jgi:predicted site-specific integrase-resolvase
MMRPDEAALVAAITPRRIYQWIEAGKLHYSEQPTGALLVCLNSLKFSSMAAVEVNVCELPAGSTCEERGSES